MGPILSTNFASRTQSATQRQFFPPPATSFTVHQHDFATVSLAAVATDQTFQSSVVPRPRFFWSSAAHRRRVVPQLIPRRPATSICTVGRSRARRFRCDIPDFEARTGPCTATDGLPNPRRALSVYSRRSRSLCAVRANWAITATAIQIFWLGRVTFLPRNL